MSFWQHNQNIIIQTCVWLLKIAVLLLFLIDCDSHQGIQSHKKSIRVDQSAHSDRLSQKNAPNCYYFKQERKCWIASVCLVRIGAGHRPQTRRKSNSSVTLNRLAYPCVDTLHRVDQLDKTANEHEVCASGRDAVLYNEFPPNHKSVAGTWPDLLILLDKKGKSQNVRSNGFTFQSAFSASTKKYKGKWFLTNRRAATYERN